MKALAVGRLGASGRRGPLVDESPALGLGFYGLVPVVLLGRVGGWLPGPVHGHTSVAYGNPPTRPAAVARL